MPDKAKKKSTRLHLGDLVERHQEVSRDPVRDGFERFLKVEHMDPGRLHVSKWGLLGSEELPPTFYNVFRKGHVLFPSRNPHLRRTVWPNFDGICGEKTFVLKVRDGLLQELLPFIMQSDALVEHAVRMKVGSTNPHVRWRDIAEFEFALPPIEEQRRIADVLASLQLAMEHCRGVGESLQSLLTSWLEVQFNNAGSVCPLGDVLRSTEYGCSTHANSKREGLPILRIPNVLRDALDLSDMKWVCLSEIETTKYLLRPGDILIVRTNGNPAYVGRCLVVPLLSEAMVYASYLIRLVVDPNRARPEYIASVLNSREVRRKLRGSVRSSAGNFNLNTEGIRSVEVPMPDIAEQDRILWKLAVFKKTQNRCQERCRELAAMQRSVIGGLEL